MGETETKNATADGQEGKPWTVEKAARAIVDALPEAAPLLKEHLDDYDGEVLIHVFSSDAVSIPMVEALQGESTPHAPQTYASLVERLWRHGDDDVVNAVDVTILEYLSDYEDAWQTFGTLISGEFRSYINDDLLKSNAMMIAVYPLIGN